MRKAFGGLLIAVGILGSPAGAWALFASRYVDEHPLSGGRAFAGFIFAGLVCVFYGVVLCLEPRKNR
jgi:hypothetical protein